MGWVLAVHIGAGRYGESAASEAAYTALVRDALETGRDLMAQVAQDDAVDENQAQERERDAASVTCAVRVATRVLRHFERSALTNCGLGANLTADGVVECEASVACGRSRVATACAGVCGVAEPSALARGLMANALNGQSALGREPPLIVVGDGARTLAASMGLETATSESELQQYQVTDAATRQWRKWHARVQGEAEPKTPEEEDENDHMDTVGVVCVDPRGNVAAALSSGGVLYKVPGRVGLAGCPRVGADARNAVVSNGPEDSGLRSDRKRPRQRQRRNGFAVACTGRGEQFIRSAFVQALTGRLVGDAIAMDEALRQSFGDAREDSGGEALEGGALALSVAPQQRRSKRLRGASSSTGAESSTLQQQQQNVELGVAFTTPCMGVGYVHDRLSEPRVQILRQPEKNARHLVVHVSCFTV